MIYTSYFAQLKKVKNPVSIALWKPKWYNGPEFQKLAPTKEILQTWKSSGKTDNDWEVYTNKYISDVLNKLSANIVVSELYSIYNSNDVTLLCYEKPGDYCHRHLIREWFKSNSILCEELYFRN